MKNTKKLNAGCIKIFQLLSLLYEDKADYNAVIEIFKDDLNETTSTNNVQVILNKYMNTLKVFGIKVVKQNNHFKLLSSLYSMHFTMDDLKSISILTNSIQNFPDKDLTEEVQHFLKQIELRMNNEDKNTLNNIQKNINYDFSFYYSDLKQQIEQCKQLCKENTMINILYFKNGEEIQCKCTPKEVLYDAKNAYLKVYNASKRQNLEIPLNTICSIAKLPQLANPIEVTTTVVYKLKNRLAKTYKLKDNEYLYGTDELGHKTIINKDEPFDKLLKRLMRYSYECEIISPKPLREEMIKTINETLNQYNIKDDFDKD